MARYRVLLVILAAVMLSQRPAVIWADTWQLQQGQDWKSVPGDAKDRYLLVVARTEKLVSTGQTKALAEEWNQLKKLFPEIKEADLDTFIKAELSFCAGEYSKASRSYEKFLAKDYYDSPFYEAALERQYRIASAFLAGQKITVLGVFKMKGDATGIRIMEKITDRAGDRPIGIEASRALAQYYENKGMFNEAYLKWSEISWQQQDAQTAKEALLAMARCKHAAYNGPKYNASHLRSAKSYYEDFKVRYPEDAAKLNVDQILKEIDEQIAYKQFCIGQYYQSAGKTQAANLYYDMVIRNWSETKAAQLAKDVLAKNMHSEQDGK